jgi:DNA-binding Lrp family transcriptional regulator
MSHGARTDSVCKIAKGFTPYVSPGDRALGEDDGCSVRLRVGGGQRNGRLRVADVQAYVLIQTEVGKAAQVAKEVRDIDGVDAAEDVTGPYDVIVRASAPNVDDLGKLVVAKIQAVDGITRTLTCPVVHL